MKTWLYFWLSNNKIFLYKAPFIAAALFFILLLSISSSAKSAVAIESAEVSSEYTSVGISVDADDAEIDAEVGVEVNAEVSPEVIIEHESETFPGGLLRVFVFAREKIENLHVLFKRENGEQIARFNGFRYDLSQIDALAGDFSDIDCMVAIIGTGSTIRPGEYRVYVFINNEEIYRKQFPVSIVRREFLTATIPLNQNLSDLRTDTSERRERESHELSGILTRFNRENVFSSEVVRKPINVEPFFITARFGDVRRFVYADGETATSIHHGIDYAAATGSHIYSCAAGKVVFAGDRLITGYTIVIEHLPGLYSLYYHLDKIYVEKDKIVPKGEKIGRLGSTGLSTGPHLHWEIRNQRFTVDPDYLMTNPMIDKDRIISIINNNFTDNEARGR
ncbi:MAG: M23 family metallopeptidase [Spirochaetaceae bacterium]|nr:M23 family metallopeptidase [Spirochaetaceae bacterium]